VKISKSSEDPDERVVARGDEATFFNKTRKIVLNGNARLWRGGDLIKGKKIDYDMNTGWITVDSAEGIIDPEKSFESEQ
jgi:lipopolysaccharide transport protein LptA